MRRPSNQVRWSRRLYLRIYLAILSGLAIAALLFGAAAHLDSSQFGASLETFADIASEVLPAPDAPSAQQQAALARWQARTHADFALYGAGGAKIAAAGNTLPPWDPSQTSSGWLNGRPPVFALKLPDGRWLLGQRLHQGHRPALGILALLGLISLAVGIGAYPIVRRLTRRLERLQTSVDALGEGHLSTRVAVEGQDEVARLADSFNRSAARIETLVDAQKALLANASHELRSPLARIRMAVELMHVEAEPALRDELRHSIRELDQLIDEILLASRLDAATDAEAAPPLKSIDLTALVAEECARVDAQLAADAVQLRGDPKLLRRLLRNLLENAWRYGGGTIEVTLTTDVTGAAGASNATGASVASRRVRLEVCDNGPGVPAAQREHIFEPFYRLPGARESDGGVGLGLSLVRQIARRHGGDVACVAPIGRDGAGSCFRVTLPVDIEGT